MALVVVTGQQIAKRHPRLVTKKLMELLINYLQFCV